MIKLGSMHGYGALVVTACVGLSTLASLGALALAGRSVARSAGAADTVTAREFILVDGDGKVRAKLGVNPRNRNSGLYLFDAAGHKLAEFDVDQDKSPELLFYGTNESPKLELMLTGDRQRPAVNLYVEVEQHASYPAVMLGVGEPGSEQIPMQRKSDGRGKLRVYDVDGSVTLREGK
jgi:hypothetical protein